MWIQDLYMMINTRFHEYNILMMTFIILQLFMLTPKTVGTNASTLGIQDFIKLNSRLFDEINEHYLILEEKTWENYNLKHTHTQSQLACTQD